MESTPWHIRPKLYLQEHPPLPRHARIALYVVEQKIESILFFWRYLGGLYEFELLHSRISEHHNTIDKEHQICQGPLTSNVFHIL